MALQLLPAFADGAAVGANAGRPLPALGAGGEH